MTVSNPARAAATIFLDAANRGTKAAQADFAGHRSVAADVGWSTTTPAR